MRWGMVIDLSKCMRCHSCIAACRNEHFLPIRVTWPRLIELATMDHGEPKITQVPIRCNQCKDAPCVDVCPTGASQKREDGIVLLLALIKIEPSYPKIKMWDGFPAMG